MASDDFTSYGPSCRALGLVFSFFGASVAAATLHWTHWSVCRGFVPGPKTSSALINGGHFRPGRSRRLVSLWEAPDHTEEPEVLWLRPLSRSVSTVEVTGIPGGVVLPFYPMRLSEMDLGVPHGHQTLEIKEPCYIQLYDDLLLSGARSFLVSPIHPETGCFAQYGIVYQLEDLQEVSTRTGGDVKYICEHSLSARMRIRQVLNPSAWWEGTTYLQVEAEYFQDIDTEEDLTSLELKVMLALKQLPPLLKELEEIHCTPAAFEEVLEDLDATRNTEHGLWRVAELWALYFEYHAGNKLLKFYDKWTLAGGGQAPLGDREKTLARLFPELDFSATKELRDLQEPRELLDPEQEKAAEQLWEEAAHDQFPRLEQKQLRILQCLVQSCSHKERLQLLLCWIHEEQRRLVALKALKAAVSGGPK